MNTISSSRSSPLSAYLPRRTLPGWELALVLSLLADFALNTALSPYFLDPYTLSDATFNFTEKGIVALPLALLIISGEIDISVAGIIALASVVMGLLAQAGFGTPVLVGAALVVGTLAGAINGLLVTVLRVSSIVATIGTMSLFRGSAYAILGDRALKQYPADFAFFGQGYVIGLISFELVMFVIVAVLCGVLLHFTAIGRRIFAIGANSTVATFSGVKTTRYRFGLFVAVGFASGLAAILLTSRLGSTRPSIAQGWELEIISMVILGGIAVSGGRGSIPGVVLAALLMGFLTFGLGLLNIPGIVMSILVGFLLIGVVALPYLLARIKHVSR
jgi:rhamnose transport system permease protein